MDESLIVEILFDTIAHAVVIQEQFALKFHQFFLILFYHSLVEPIGLWQHIIGHTFLILNHLLLLNFVHDFHLELLLKAFHTHVRGSLLPFLDGLALVFYLLIQVKLVFFPLLGL